MKKLPAAKIQQERDNGRRNCSNEKYLINRETREKAIFSDSLDELRGMAHATGVEQFCEQVQDSSDLIAPALV